MARVPAATLVGDANIVLGAALSKRSDVTAVVAKIAEHRVLFLSEHAVEESLRIGTKLAEKRGTPPPTFDGILNLFAIVPAATYAGAMPRAADTLRLAVASRNGSTADAHVLALAWATDSDVWSADRDFAGTGWPSWSTANLLRALDPDADEQAAQ